MNVPLDVHEREALARMNRYGISHVGHVDPMPAIPLRSSLQGRRRNLHQKFAEILPAQEADKGARRVLEPLDHIFAILNPSLADPGGDIAHEILMACGKVGDDETAKRQPLG
jgi:hypothetical protein